MQDFYIRTATIEDMLKAIALFYTEPIELTPMLILESQNPQWVMLYIGNLYEPQEYIEGKEPETPVALPGVHMNLRWLGPDCPDLSTYTITPNPQYPRYLWA